MSSSRHGPQRSRRGYAHSPGVYRRRRLLVLVVFALVVWGVVRFVPSLGDDPEPASASPADTKSRSTSKTSAADAQRAEKQRTNSKKTPKKTSKKTPKKTSKKTRNVRVALPRPQGKCDPAKVLVTPTVTGTAHAGGEVGVRLRFGYTGSEPCTLRIGPKSLLLQVDNEDGVVWKSTSCDEVDKRTVVLQPTWARLVRARWSGRESVKNCDKLGEMVNPGSYTMHAAVLGGEPAHDDFELRPRPKPKKTEKSGSKKSGSKKSGSKKSGSKKSGEDESESKKAGSKKTESTKSENADN